MKKNFKKLLLLAVVVLTIMASATFNTKGYIAGNGEKDPPLSPVITLGGGEKDPPLRMTAYDDTVLPFGGGEKDPPL